jgi:hypothetical protein
MSGGDSPSPVSTLLVDESFATAGAEFVELVRSVSSPKYLAGLADRWKRDPRPWAREQIIHYLSLPMDRPGQHPVVKRLFKQAEANKDDELMAHFLAAFDRLVRRERKMRYQWDPETRQMWQAEVLYAPKNQILASAGTVTTPNREGVNPFTGEKITFPSRTIAVGVPKNGRLFSYATRQYLRRRAWRYFRRMGFQRPGDYPAAIGAALALYRDEDLEKGENILDSWSLMNAAFYHSPAVKIESERVRLADGHSLAELEAAPRFAELWKKPESAAVLTDLLVRASSRLVRVWSMELLKRHHVEAMQSITAEQLLSLLDHEDDEVQQFGASLLNSLSAVDRWPIETWLRLLETRSLDALATICDVMSRRVTPQRLTLMQCVELACARATPVARLGLSWLKERGGFKTPPLPEGEGLSEADRATLAGLSAARCDAIGADAAQFALSILGSSEHYQTDAVIQFFDSLNAEVRRGAWEWLTPQSPAYNDATLWSRLVETPYDDVRMKLVEALERRSAGVSLRERDHLAERDDYTAVWAAVLLNVHRGGRAKLKALRQISEAIAERPEMADVLIPVLSVALRSVRPPEVRGGLSSIVRAVAARPELESVLAKHLPELRLSPTEVRT